MYVFTLYIIYIIYTYKTEKNKSVIINTLERIPRKIINQKYFMLFLNHCFMNIPTVFHFIYLIYNLIYIYHFAVLISALLCILRSDYEQSFIFFEL